MPLFIQRASHLDFPSKDLDTSFHPKDVLFGHLFSSKELFHLSTSFHSKDFPFRCLFSLRDLDTSFHQKGPSHLMPLFIQRTVLCRHLFSSKDLDASFHPKIKTPFLHTKDRPFEHLFSSKGMSHLNTSFHLKGLYHDFDQTYIITLYSVSVLTIVFKKFHDKIKIVFYVRRSIQKWLR
jgi:hypothetical protein